MKLSIRGIRANYTPPSFSGFEFQQLTPIHVRRFYDKGVIEDEEVQDKIDMESWTLQAEKQALEKKIEKAKQKKKAKGVKPFKGEKVDETSSKKRKPSTEAKKSAKKIKQNKFSFFFKSR